MNYSVLLLCFCTVTPGSPQICIVLLPSFLYLCSPSSLKSAPFLSPFYPTLPSTPLSWLKKLLIHLSRFKVSVDSFLVLSLSLHSRCINFSFHTQQFCCSWLYLICQLLKREIMVCFKCSGHIEIFIEWMIGWIITASFFSLPCV